MKASRKLAECIILSADKFAPMKRPLLKKKKWVTRELKKSINMRDHKYKYWCNGPDNDTKRNDFLEQRKVTKLMTINARKPFVQKKTRSSKDDSKGFHRVVNSIIGNKNHPFNNVSMMIKL